MQDTGLLDELVSRFQAQRKYDVTPTVAGSGQILSLARQGELDALMTHSPADEQKLLDEGEVIERRAVMEDDFVVVGPPDDPAHIAGAATPAAAFQLIATAGAGFISRGDKSGTNQRELAVWREAGIDPASQNWYQESAVGQGQNLVISSDKGAYTITDSATFRVFQDRVSLKLYVTDPDVANVYSVMIANPDRHANAHVQAARAFADFVTSPETQAFIAGFGADKYGAALFRPAR